MKLLTLCLVGLSICGAYSAIPHPKSCLPPNGGGLYSVLKEFEDNIPYEQFANIALKAATSDSQVKAVYEYLQSNEYTDAIMGIVKSPQFQDLFKFFCEKLFMDVPNPNDFYSHSVDASISAEFPEAKYIRNRPGFIGMLLDMLDLVPFDKLEASFNERYSNDVYLREAVKNLHSEEFKSILHSLDNLSETQTIYGKLQEIGVDINELKQVNYKMFYYILDN